jgi:hypothetical protein
MRRAIAIVLATAAGAATSAAPAGAATVQTMVVGKDRVLRSPRAVTLRSRTVRVGGKRCAVARNTPLAALLGTGLRVRLRDYGSCGGRTRDSGSLFVTQVGSDRNRGRNGWVYKVGRKAGTAGAADPAGPFGSGGLRAGDRVTWFWCVLSSSDSCQRTLEVTPSAVTVEPGSGLLVTVRGYDDSGRGINVLGATVTLGAVKALTGTDGTATLTVPATPGKRLRLGAAAAGMVDAFPREVTVA